MPEPMIPVAENGSPDLERFLRPSRSRGERGIGIVRLAFVLLSMLAIAAWSLLHPDARPPALPWLMLVELVYLSSALGFLLRGPRETDARSVGYVAAAVDVVLVTAVLALFAAGDRSGPRADLIRALSPLVFVTFILLSVGRHDPGNALFTGAGCSVAYVVLHLVSVAAFGGEPVQEALSLLLLAASVLVGWLVSREALELAENSARAEQALQREQIHLLRLFESTPEAVVLLTPESRIVRANAAFVSLFGYAQEELAGRSIDELIVPEELAGEAASFTALTGGGQALNVETVRRRKDGMRVDVSILGAPVFQHGRQVAIFGTYRNTAERRRRERLFEGLNRAALGMLRSASDDEAFEAAAGELQGMKMASVLLVLEPGGASLRLTHLRASRRIRGALEQILGGPLVGLDIPLVPESRYVRLLAEREPVYTSDKAQAVSAAFPEAPPRAKEELARLLAPFPSVTVPLLREGKAFGLLIALSRDLTPGDLPAVGAFGHQLAAALAKVGLIRALGENLRELTLAQTRFVQSQKLEAVGRLAGGIAHDFNNLLTIINGYAELLAEGFAKGDPHAQEAEEILRAGRRAAALTGQLLAFSRRQVLRVELVDLNAVAAGMQNALLRLLGEDIRLELDLSPAPFQVRADAAQMEQAILNIALNARDAMRDGGTLTVRTAAVEPDAAFLSSHPELHPDRYACIRIEDSGTGIPPEVLPHVFEPFFTTKEPGRGTGLGLAMVYGFVKQSGGCVYAEDRAEGGACFSVYLPIVTGEETADPEVPRESSARVQGGTECILLVEDEASVLAYAGALLERGGYRVLALPSAEEALALDPARLQEVDLLVTDVVMPGMNGKALAGELLRRLPGLRVLFTSGYAEEVFSRLGMSPGEHPLLEKPYSGPDLLRRVREILDRRDP